MPDRDSKTGAEVLSAALRVLIAEMLRIGPAHASAPTRRDEMAALHDLFVDLAKTAPGALASLARLPTVGALVRCLRGARGTPQADAWLGELALTVATELAFAGALARPVTVTAPPARNVALGRRASFAVPSGSEAITVEPTGRLLAISPGGPPVAIDAESPSPFTAIAPGLVLATVDESPLRMVEAHPDKSGNAIDLGGRDAAVWTHALGGALDTIERFFPAFRREIDLFVRQIVPVGYFDETHLSASYREAIGTIYLSLHPSPLTLVEAIIHETSHNKLNALLELDPLLDNDPSERYASPVRPDGRPLMGVLLAVHAFVPVAELYARWLRENDDATVALRWADVRKKNAEGAAVLRASARPTARGRSLLDEIDRRTSEVG
ncbi:MAG TPA: HEXXH motif-containing putative peptide modification protein [Polyangiaceae bacterium]|nr:HEXXH motif-containing putative peptide modification protein [Polyangiaceae bacterium]